MNVLGAVTQFVRSTGRYDLVGVKRVDGEDVPDFMIDNGAWYYVQAALDWLSDNVRVRQNRFEKTVILPAGTREVGVDGLILADVVKTDAGGRKVELQCISKDEYDTLDMGYEASELLYWCQVPDKLTEIAGEEVEEGVIEIGSIEEMQRIGNDPGYPLDGKYALKSDISAAATAGWNGGKGFAPIGSLNTPFRGVFDGRGHTISNLTIDRPGEAVVGLFVRNLGLIKRLVVTGTVKGGDVSGAEAEAIGGICGWNGLSGVGLMEDCWSKVNVFGYGTRPAGATGGVCGRCSGKLSRCMASGNISGGDSVGGLTGVSSYMIEDCSASGNVTGVRHVGGLAGSGSGIYKRCYATGDVTCVSGYFAGGLFGHFGRIGMGDFAEDCYYIGNVYGNSAVGGFAGKISSQVRRCYSAAQVTGTGGDVGPFAGEIYAPITDCYYDSTKCGLPNNSSAVGKSTQEMMERSTYVGWNFIDIWDISGSYPFLREPRPAEVPMSLVNMLVYPAQKSIKNLYVSGWYRMPKLSSNYQTNWWLEYFPQAVVHVAAMILYGEILNPDSNVTLKGLVNDIVSRMSVVSVEQELRYLPKGIGYARKTLQN